MSDLESNIAQSSEENTKCSNILFCQQGGGNSVSIGRAINFFGLRTISTVSNVDANILQQEIKVLNVVMLVNLVFVKIQALIQ